jgi:hypothetical protein
MRSHYQSLSPQVVAEKNAGSQAFSYLFSPKIQESNGPQDYSVYDQHKKIIKIDFYSYISLNFLIQNDRRKMITLP